MREKIKNVSLDFRNIGDAIGLVRGQSRCGLVTKMAPPREAGRSASDLEKIKRAIREEKAPLCRTFSRRGVWRATAISGGTDAYHTELDFWKVGGNAD